MNKFLTSGGKVWGKSFGWKLCVKVYLCEEEAKRMSEATSSSKSFARSWLRRTIVVSRFSASAAASSHIILDDYLFIHSGSEP